MNNVHFIPNGFPLGVGGLQLKSLRKSHWEVTENQYFIRKRSSINVKMKIVHFIPNGSPVGVGELHYHPCHESLPPFDAVFLYII